MQWIKDVVKKGWEAQMVRVVEWHRTPVQALPVTAAVGTRRLGDLILAEHLVNFRLWHVEDRARRRDVDDAVIAGCKREIDGLNQQRNDFIEQIDACLIELIAPHLPENSCQAYNTETVGSAMDRLSILSLKIYHMGEQTERNDVGAEHLNLCRARLEVLVEQRADLGRSVLELLDEYARGGKRPKVYFQFKMYNDPALNPELYAQRQQPKR